MTAFSKPFNAPIPTLVIAVGPFAQQVARGARDIYLRSDGRRGLVSRFLEIVPDGEEGLPVLRPLTAVQGGNSGEPDEVETPELRKNLFVKAALNTEEWKASIQTELHQIRIHEQVIAAGWAASHDVPANIFILADLKDAYAAAVFPLMAVSRSMLADDLMCRTWLMGNMAVFPSEQAGQMEEQQAQVWSFLNELDELLDLSSERRERLAKITGLPDTTAGYHETVYLFDQRKEGSTYVKDQAGMSLMMENALLALLEAGVARRMAALEEMEENLESRGYYGSIGAAAVVYNPLTFQEACACRLACSFLESFILCEPPDRQPARLEAEAAEEHLGSVSRWFVALTVNMPPECGQVQVRQPGNLLFAQLPPLDLAPFDFEDLRSLDWDRCLIDFYQELQTTLLPLAQKALAASGEQLEQDLLNMLQAWVERLPLNTGLYPGGLLAGRSAIEILRDNLQRRKGQLEQEETQKITQADELGARFRENMNRMRVLIQSIPALPFWLRPLPRRLRAWLVPVYYMRRCGRQMQALTKLRKDSLAVMETGYSSALQAEAIKRLLPVLDPIFSFLDGAEADFCRMEDVFRAVHQDLTDAKKAEPQVKDPSSEVFRMTVGSDALMDWGYLNWMPENVDWLKNLFDEDWMQQEWRSVSKAQISNWLKRQGMQAYQPFWNLDLDQVEALEDDLRGRDRDANTCAQGFIRQAVQATLPLLRPNFDASGGNRNSHLRGFALFGSHEWKRVVLADAPDPHGWQVLYGGSPYLAVIFQARSGAPLLSFSGGLIEGQRKLRAVKAEEDARYELIGSPERMVQNIPAQPDEEVKRFIWTFKPRGAHDEIEQRIDLPIQRQRYEHYRRLPRLNGQWNCYAEEEMPEVRNLALAFQHLHAGHTWSTYTQVSNVLNFVQSCIPYSSDLKTTGYEDWARYPVETLMEGTGDCEDLAILCAAVIARLGFQVMLLLYPHHLAFAVAGADHLKGEYILDPHSGKRYFYGEATAQGWHLGQIPKTYAGLLPDQMLPVAILIDENEEDEE